MFYVASFRDFATVPLVNHFLLQDCHPESNPDPLSTGPMLYRLIYLGQQANTMFRSDNLSSNNIWSLTLTAQQNKPQILPDSINS